MLWRCCRFFFFLCAGAVLPILIVRPDLRWPAALAGVLVAGTLWLSLIHI